MDPFLLAAIEEAELGLAEGGVSIRENQSFLGEEKLLADHLGQLSAWRRVQGMERV